MSTVVKNKDINMTEGPFLKKMVLFSIPVLLTVLLQQLYQSLDLMVVGKYASDTALAAVGSVGSLNSLVTAVFMGLSVGAGVVAAQKIGAGQSDQVSKVIHSSALLAIVLGGTIGLIGVFLSRTLLVMTNAPAEVLDQATVYMQLIFAGTPATILYNYMASILRSAGDSRRPLYFLLVSGAVKVMMNFLFVRLFHWDVAGVALATTLAYYLSTAIVIIYMMKQKGYLHFSFRLLGMNGAIVKQILIIGIPSGIQSSLSSLSNVVIQSSVNSFGEFAISGNSVADNLGTYVYYGGNAVYQAVLTFVGQNMGAKKYKNIKKVVLWGLFLAVAVSFAIGGMFLVFREFFVGLLIDDTSVTRDFAYQRMYIEMPLYFLCGIMEVLSGALRGMGKSVTSTVVSLLGSCAFRIVWVNTVFLFVERNIGWVFISKPISFLLVATFNGLFFLIYYRRCARDIEKVI